MANNRLWLIHRPSGASVYLGKRMGLGWYQDKPEQLAEKLEEFFKEAEGGSDGHTQDDFILGLEDASGAPSATDKWQYVGHKPKLLA